MTARTLLLFLALVPPALGQQNGVALPPLPGRPEPSTLAALVKEAKHVSFLRVEAVDAEAGVLQLSTSRILKGEPHPLALLHRLGKVSFLKAIRPGSRAVLFTGDGWASVLCSAGRYDFKDEEGRAVEDCPFVGSVEELAIAVRVLLDGKEMVIAVPRREGRDGERGRHGTIWRVRASLANSGEIHDFAPLEKRFVCHGAADKRGVPALLRRLAHEDEYERCRAANALGSMGTEALGAVRALKRALKGKDAHLRLYAADALMRIEPCPEAIRCLGEALRKKVPDAMEVVQELGERALPLVPDVLAILEKDKDVGFRHFAAYCLGQIGRPSSGRAADTSAVVVGLLRATEDEMVPVRVAALDSLRLVAQPSRAVLEAFGRSMRGEVEDAEHARRLLGVSKADLMPAFRVGFSGEPRERNLAFLREIQRAGPRARVLAPVLHRHLRSPNPLYSNLAASALLAVAPDIQPQKIDAVLAANAAKGHFDGMDLVGIRVQMPKLVAVLRELVKKRPFLVWPSAKLLSELGIREEVIGDALAFPNTAELNFFVETFAAHKRPDRAVAMLLLLLDLGEFVQHPITEDFVRLGPATRSAIPTLHKRLADPLAAECLWRIGRPDVAGERVRDVRQDALAALCRSLDSEKESSRIKATHALGRIGPVAARAVPALIRIVEKHDCHAAVAALGKIGSPKAVPLLRKLGKEGEPSMRLAAGIALARCLPRDPKGWEILKEIDRLAPHLRRQWLLGLPKECLPREAVPLLVRMLRDPETEPKAAELLRKLDPPALRKAGTW